jgi:hypothetical protein
MKFTRSKSVLVLALIVVATILYFKLIFFDQFEKNPMLTDGVNRRLRRIVKREVLDSLERYNIQVVGGGGLTQITNGKNSWQVRSLILHIEDVNPSYLVMLTGNYSWDSGLKTVLLPAYSDLHILSTSTLDELATFRISGYIHAACIDTSYVYFRFAEGTYGRVSLDQIGQRK